MSSHIRPMRKYLISSSLFFAFGLICMGSLANPSALPNNPPGPTGPFGSAETARLLIDSASREPLAKKAVRQAEQAMHLADSLQDTALKAAALRASGIAWKNMGDLMTSHDRLSASLGLYTSLHQEMEVHIVKRDLAETYRAAEAYNLALDLALEALAFFRRADVPQELARTHNRLAAIRIEQYHIHPDHGALRKQALDSIRFFDSLADFPELDKRFHESLAYLDSATYLAQQFDMSALVFSNDILRAGILAESGYIHTALSLYDQTAAAMQASGIDRDLPLVLIQQARVLGRPPLNRHQQAISLAHRASELAMQSGIAIYVFLAEEVLHNSYHAMGHFREAYRHLGQSKDMLARFQFDQLLMQSTIQDYENKLQMREMELKHRQRVLRLTVLFSVAGILVFSIFAFLLYRKNKFILKQNQALESSNANKDLLLSIIAHDVRSPFSGIMGLSEELHLNLSKLDRGKILRLAKAIHLSSKQVYQLLDNLLDWASMRKGTMAFSPAQLDLPAAYKQVLDLVQENAAYKDIKLVSHIPEKLVVWADENLLQTILRNLLGNAIKFTDKGGQIKISSANTPSGVEISVTDSGTGMAQEKLDVLFERQAGMGGGGINQAGSGLGLALCKAFVEKHGGWIRAESLPGKGSTFVFFLPHSPAG